MVGASASDIEDIYELSPLQQGMLLHSAHDGASDMYLSQQTYHVDGPLDTDVLVRAWYRVVADHPALRASFHWRGLEKPLQVVHRRVELPVHAHDWSDVPASLQTKWLDQLYADDRAAGMDLAVAPLQRLHVITLDTERYCLVWTYHHLLLDGWSVAVFMNDLLAHYHHLAGGGPAPVPGPPFSTYIAWLQERDTAGTRDFWTDLLAGVGESRPIPLAPVDPRASTGAVDRRKITLPAPLVQALRATAARHQVTVATTVQAAWATALRSLTGDPHTTFGCASSGRPTELPDAARIIGVFANTLPVRITVPRDGEVGPWLREIQHTYAQMRRYEYTPLADIMRWAGASGRQLFQTLLSLENYPASVDTEGLAVGLTIRPSGLYDKINFPVALSAVPETGSLDLAVHRERFPEGFVDDVLTHLQTTFEALTTTDDVATVVSAAGTIAIPEPVPVVAPVVVPDPDGTGSPLEDTIVEVFREILEVDDIDATTGFFDVGGDSFAAVRAISRIPGASVGLLAAHPTPRELAAAIAATDPADPDDPAALTAAPPASAAAELLPVPRNGHLVCTYQQEGAWFLNQFNPASTVLHVPFALRLRGELDVPAMTRALRGLLVRHEALRTRFVDIGGSPRQIVDPPPARMPLRVVRLSEERIGWWAAKHCNEPFDLAAGPVVRAAVARTGPDEHVLVMVLHHIVSDGWSVSVLGRELSELYAAETAGRPAQLPELQLQPADYAAWQRQWLTGPELERQLGFWRDTLADLPTVDFPTDRPRPAQPTGAGTSIGRRLPDDVAAAAHAYVRRHRVSLLALFQAAMLTVVHRYTGQDDLPIGSMFSGRTRPDIEPLVGYFGNVLVLRTDVGGDPTFAELVERCHRTILDATTHQDAPFRLVVDALAPERVNGRNPLFQIGLTLLPSGIGSELRLGEVTGEIIGVPERYSLYDISVDVADDGEGRLDLAVEYATELFDGDRMARFLEHIVTALTGGLDAPDTVAGEVDLVSAAERDQLLDAAGHPVAPVHRLIAATAARTPFAVAMVDHDGDPWSYQQLDEWTNQLARWMREHGVGRGVPVGICFHPGADLLTALVAVWKAGGIHVPLDPDRPAADDASVPALVVTSEEHARRFDAALVVDTAQDEIDTASTDPLQDVTALDDVAGVISTAGSGGAPATVVVTHRTIAEQLSRLPEIYPLQPTDRVLHVTPYGFDASIRDLFWPLVTGAAVVFAAPGGHRDARYLYRLAGHEKITVLHLPTAILRTVLRLRTTRAPAGLRRVCVTGDALTTETVDRFHAAWPGTELYNVWSSAETSSAVACRCEPGTAAPIGRPLSNRTAYVLDDQLRPVPIGMAGHLYVGGAGLAPGYLDRAALTARRFVADPFADRPGQRMFTTGDLARWRADGLLEHVGRHDRQAVLRGQRIELDRIENLLAGHPAVRRCRVTMHDDAFLAAYVVGAAGRRRPDVADLRRHLADRLPAYMVPARVVVLSTLPLTANGKPDAAALPAVIPPASGYLPPRTATERWVATTVQGLLGVAEVGSGDSIFDLGGNSLHATQVIAAVRDELGIDVHLRRLFAGPTVEQFAAVLDEEAHLTDRLRWRWWVRGRVRRPLPRVAVPAQPIRG